MPISLFLHLLLLTALLQGCVSSYSPPGPVVPLLHKAGDLSVGANLRPAFPKRGANAYVAAAPTAHTRLYVNASISRLRGERGSDDSGRNMSEKNITTQVEAAFGWGAPGAYRTIMEAFGGIGYGHADTHQCVLAITDDSPVHCAPLWVNAEAHFVRVFAQLQRGKRWSKGSFGGGLRISNITNFYESLMGKPSDRVANVQTAEPFVSGSFGLPWGKLELSFIVPFVISRTYARYPYDDTGEPDPNLKTPLVEHASPRFTLGIRADLFELWRKRREE